MLPAGYHIRRAGSDWIACSDHFGDLELRDCRAAAEALAEDHAAEIAEREADEAAAHDADSLPEQRTAA